MSICCCSAKVPAQLVSRIIRRLDPPEKLSNTLDRHSVELVRKERIAIRSMDRRCVLVVLRGTPVYFWTLRQRALDPATTEINKRGGRCDQTQ